MPASPIRKLVPFAEAAKRDGKTVYHLNIGQPDIETPDEGLEALQNVKDRVLEYSHSAGLESYRKKLIHYYKEHQINLNLEDVMITTGGSEAISFGIKTCLEVGDEIIIPEPFYTNYNAFCRAAGVKINPIPSHIEDGFALPPIEKFEEKITPHTKAVMICNPNNPTGYLYSKDEILKLKELVLKHNLFLFADEVYREFCYDGAEHFSVMQLDGLEEHAVLFDSVSKRYSECGIRIGALISRNKKVMEAAMKFAQARLSPPYLGQVVAEASLKATEDYFTKVNREYTKRRNFVIDYLNKIPGVFAPLPKGAFYCVAKLPIDDSDRFCQWLLEDFEYNQQTVMMAPASGFYATTGFGKSEVRIAYVLEIEKLRNAMLCLEKALQEYPGRL